MPGLGQFGDLNGGRDGEEEGEAKRTDVPGTGVWRPPYMGEKESCDGAGVEEEKKQGAGVLSKVVESPG